MDNVRDKIKKLLAMANDERGNEHENEIAMRMAARLMLQHNIEVADLESESGKSASYTWRSIIIPLGEHAKHMSWNPLWTNFLATGTGRFTDCRVTRVVDKTYGCCIKFEGDETDIEYAAWLFKKLRDFGYAESKAVPNPQRDTFLKAYSIRLSERMRTLRAERDSAMKQAVTKTGNALMVVNNKLALRDAEFGKQQVKNTRVKFASQGFREGRQAADRANFRRPIGGGAQKLIH